MAIRLWGNNWTHQKIVIKCDNQAVVSILKLGKTKDSALACIARNILLEAARLHITMSVIHMLGKNNVVADTLSRWQNTHNNWHTLYSSIENPIWVHADASLLTFYLSI